MTNAADFPTPDYTELFGISRADLDALGEAQQQAESAVIGLRDWRAVYDKVFARYPGAEASVELVHEHWTRQCSRIWFGHGDKPIPAAWARLSNEERQERGQALMTDLCALQQPPAHEDLQRLFAEVDEKERRARASGKSEFVDIYAEHKLLLSRWISETDGTVRDPWSGLPLERIEANRWIEDEVLGRVPVAARAATARTWLDSTRDERNSASGVANGPHHTENDWKSTHAFASLSGIALSEFLRWLTESDDPSAAAVMNEWHHGNLPTLVQEYLDGRA